MNGWVCPECGLNYDTILPPDMVVALRSYPRRYREFFPPRDDDEKPDGVIRRRPAPGVWSALEYAAHVSDVFDELADVVQRMVKGSEPTMKHGLDPDARATEAKYNEQDRDAVLARLETSAEHMADVIARVPNDAWRRTATFPFGERDVLTMARNSVHEGYHHLRDIESVLSRVVGN
jgi:hypothetical protein